MKTFLLLIAATTLYGLLYGYALLTAIVPVLSVLKAS